MLLLLAFKGEIQYNCHAYCYQHLKKNFNIIVTKHNTRKIRVKNVHFNDLIVLHMHVG